MFKIYKTDSCGYIVSTRQNAIACNSLTKLIQVLKGIGVDDDEIEYGLVELEINSHNIAEYGINKRFLFSKKVA